MRARASAVAAVVILMLGIVAATRAASATGTPGGLAGVSYEVANAPADGFTTVSFPLTVLDNENPDASWYWADQVVFVGDGSIAYLGLQPHGQYGQTALFSVFGDGTSGGSSSCATGADGGSGTSCHIAYPWQVGTTYTFTMSLISHDASTETWGGSVTDSGSATRTDLGVFTVAAGRGLIRPDQGFAEYYASVSDCSAIPRMSVRYDAPNAALNGLSYPGTVSGAYGYGSTNGSYIDCSSVAHVSHTSSSGYLAAPDAPTTNAPPTADPSASAPPAAPPPAPPPATAVAPPMAPAKGAPVTVAPPGAGATRFGCVDYHLSLSISVISVPIGTRVLVTGSLMFRDNPDVGIPVTLTERYADGKTVPLATVVTDSTGTFAHYHRPRFNGAISAVAGCLRPKPVPSRAELRVSRPHVGGSGVGRAFTASISPGSRASQRAQLVEVGPDGSVLGVLAVAPAGRLARGSNPIRFSRVALHAGRECLAVRALGTKVNAGSTSRPVCLG